MTDEERAAQRAYQKAWRLANPDKVKQYKTKWRSKKRNRKKESEYHKQWVENNRDHVREYYAGWVAKKVAQEMNEKENEA